MMTRILFCLIVLLFAGIVTGSTACHVGNCRLEKFALRWMIVMGVSLVIVLCINILFVWESV